MSTRNVSIWIYDSLSNNSNTYELRIEVHGDFERKLGVADGSGGLGCEVNGVEPLYQLEGSLAARFIYYFPQEIHINSDFLQNSIDELRASY